MDDFLTADALAELYAFSLETTVWNEVKERGYLGAYLRDGYFPNVRPVHCRCPFLLRLALQCHYVRLLSGVPPARRAAARAAARDPWAPVTAKFMGIQI